MTGTKCRGVCIRYDQVVGDSKEFWKKRKEEMSSQVPRIEWEITN